MTSRTRKSTLRRWGVLAAMAVMAALSQAVGGSGLPLGQVRMVEAPPGAAFLLAAGDIASCRWDSDEATAHLLDAHPGATIATLGDTVYPDATSSYLNRCFANSWGRHLDRIRPASGNHDYLGDRADDYFEYFGPAAGDPDEGWYSYQLGHWRIMVLNSNCEAVDCTGDGPQADWLRAQLAAHPAGCTLAYWHHPRFSSGNDGSTLTMDDLWSLLYRGGADVVLSAHEHSYERLAPMDASGRLDPERGIRSFVVGTGGTPDYEFRAPLPATEVRHSGTSGVLRLTLFADRYEWRFLPVEGERFTDSGSARCH